MVHSFPTRRSSDLEPSLAVDSESSPSATLIHVVAEDRPGLLYDLVSVMSKEGCNIEVVLIDTEAHKAMDVFYITRQGQKLESAQEQQLRRRLLEKL